MNTFPAGRVLAALLAVTCVSQAATNFTETFSGGLNGWFDRDVAKLTVTNSASGNPGGAMSGVFGFQAFPGPELDAFAANAGTSGGAFVGDYTAAGIGLIGFDFFAANVLPSEMRIRIGSSNKVFFSAVESLIPATGQWTRVERSLRSLVDGAWAGGTEEEFRIALTNIAVVQIEILRSGTAAQEFRVDNIFIDALPSASSATLGPDGWSVQWSNLRSGTVYSVESSTNLVAGWSFSSSLSATSRVQTITVTNPPPSLFLRLSK